MSNIQHLQSLCVIHVDFDIWSGQTRLTAADLKLGQGGEIPPDHIAQLGSKRICDPAKLKGFHRLKTETRRLLLRYGMPFMNGFAVPVAKAVEICDRLDQVAAEFNTIRNDFISSYNTAVNEWVTENPAYETAIRTGTLPRETVEKRIGFEYQVFMIQPVNDSHDMRLTAKVERLGDDLISEMAEEATKFYSEKLAGRDQCAVSTRITLRNIRDKLDGLSFLNSTFVPLVDLLDTTLKGYEVFASGRNISGAFFYQVMAVVLIMSDRQRIEGYANGLVNVDAYSQSLVPQAGRVARVVDVSVPNNVASHVQPKPGNSSDIDDFFSQFEQPDASVVNSDVVELENVDSEFSNAAAPSLDTTVTPSESKRVVSSPVKQSKDEEDDGGAFF